MRGRARVLGMAVTIVAALTVAGAVAGQLVLRQIAPRLRTELAALTGAQVRWGRVLLTPWGSIVVTEVEALLPGGTQPQIRMSQVTLHYRWSDLLHHQWWRVRQITVQHPRILLEPPPQAADTLTPPLAGIAAHAHVSAWPTEPVRIVIQGASLALAGQPPMLRGGTVTAEWRQGQVEIHRAELAVLGTRLQAHGTLTGLGTADPQWQCSIHWYGPQFSGQLELRDSLRHPTVVGQVTPARAAPIPIASHATVTRERVDTTELQVGPVHAMTGTIDWVRRQWRLTISQVSGGVVTVQGRLFEWPQPQCEVGLVGVRVGPMTVSSTIHVASRGLAGFRRGVEGVVTTSGTMVNGHALGEVTGVWTVTPEALELESWQLGTRGRLSGRIALRPPHAMALGVEVTELDVARVASAVDPGKAPAASGGVHGRIDFSGNPRVPRVRGFVAGRDGTFGGGPYETATINFEGEGTVIRFLDSRLQRPNELVVMEGSLDVAQLGTPRVFEHVRLIPYTHRPSWQEPVAPSMVQ